MDFLLFDSSERKLTVRPRASPSDKPERHVGQAAPDPLPVFPIAGRTLRLNPSYHMTSFVVRARR